MSDHPTPAELEATLLKQLSPERTRLLVVHLLKGCEQCRSGLSALLVPVKAEVQLSLEEDAAYDAAIDRAMDAALQRSGKMGDLETIEALLEHSWALRYESPSEMVRLARMASTLADHLSPDRYDLDQMTGIRLRALTELGNAFRVADELEKATEALDRAAEILIQGTFSDRLSARYFDVLASLYGAYRFFEMARFALTVSYCTYRRIGDEHLVGRTLISLGIYTGYGSDPEEAVHLIRQGLDSVDENRDPDLVFSGIQAQARFLLDCGRPREAKFVLWDLKKRHPDAGGRVNELKVRWLEGQIFAGMEAFESAEQALLQVKEGFAQADLPYKSALAGLELGAVWLRQGRLEEAKKVALESVEVFIALHIRREVMAAVLMLKKAFETRVATAALVESVADFLRRAEEDPHLRFEPRALRGS